MARPRKPAHLLEVSGAFVHDPKRRRRDPRPSGRLGSPPRHLNREQRKAWREIAAAAPPGVLFYCDRLALEIATTLVVHLRQHGPKASLVAQLVSLLGKLGLTPADRTRLGVPAENPRSLREQLEQQAVEAEYFGEEDPAEKYFRR